MQKNKEVPFESLKGKVIVRIDGLKEDSDCITFFTEDGCVFQQYHKRDCCEEVSLVEVNGDLEDLIGYEILVAEEVVSEEKPPRDPEYDDSYTWSFYKLATIKGWVDFRWYGTSNGYYSETVDLYKIVETTRTIEHIVSIDIFISEEGKNRLCFNGDTDPDIESYIFKAPAGELLATVRALSLAQEQLWSVIDNANVKQ
ncbi:MAG: hypothetical protein IJK99_09080 [Bacteroidales bacterium]|nr:hypothetical protein [Bacteroidales bacterium]